MTVNKGLSVVVSDVAWEQGLKVGSFATWGPLRPSWAIAARAGRGEEWLRPAERVHQLLTPFVWGMKNLCGEGWGQAACGPVACWSRLIHPSSQEPLAVFSGILPFNNFVIIKNDRL